MADLTQRMSRCFEIQSSIYGFRTTRDRHLDSRAVCEAGTHSSILDRCAALLGEDLLLWRSRRFRKPPGGAEIHFHQGRNFPGRVTSAPALDPAEGLSCWLALENVNRANGCVKLLPGTHESWIEPQATSRPGIFGRGFELPGLEDIDPVYMELEPGEFFLFHDSTVHGSDANHSATNRTGIVYRFTPTSTRIYSGLRIDGSGMPLRRWRALLVRGEDRFGHNRLGTMPDRDSSPRGFFRRQMGRISHRYYKRFHGLKK